MATQPLPRIQRDAIREILRQLRAAERAISAAIRGATDADRARRLASQRAEIVRVMDVFRAAAESRLHGGIASAWAAGAATIRTQVALGMVAGVSPAGRINARVLLAMREFLTHRIADVSREAVEKLNTALAQHLLGVISLSELVTQIQRILGGITRRRAMTIAYTEIGRAYSAAQYEQMLEQAKVLPGLKKRWIHSQKEHGRPGHILCADATKSEPIPVAEPFEVLDLRTGEVEQLRYPRDPQGSPGQTINCGCMMVAVPPEDEEYKPLADADIIPAGTVVRSGVVLPSPGGSAATPGDAGRPVEPPAPPSPIDDDYRPLTDADIIPAGTVVRNGVVVRPGDGAFWLPPVPPGGDGGGPILPPMPPNPYAQRTPWPPLFPAVELHAIERLVKDNAWYAAAKAGDTAAAASLIEALANDDVIRTLIATHATQRPMLVPVVALEATGRNAIPSALARYLAAATQWPLEAQIVQTSVAGRTGQDGYYRLAIQPLFGGPVLRGQTYLLVDDFAGQGATFANLRGFIERAGGRVVGATALTGNPASTILALQPETLTELRAVHGPELENWWRELFGFGFDALTESEARYLIARTDADRIRREILARLLGRGG